MSAVDTLQQWQIELGQGATRSSGLALTKIVVLRLRAAGVERAYALSATDARVLASQLNNSAAAAEPEAE